MQATARRLSVVSATSCARRRLIRDVRPRGRVLRPNAFHDGVHSQPTRRIASPAMVRDCTDSSTHAARLRIVCGRTSDVFCSSPFRCCLLHHDWPVQLASWTDSRPALSGLADCDHHLSLHVPVARSSSIRRHFMRHSFGWVLVVVHRDSQLGSWMLTLYSR